MDKVYFNLTKIQNGWLLVYSPFTDEFGMSAMKAEKFFKTLDESFDFIKGMATTVKNWNSMNLRHLFAEEDKK